MKRPVALLSFSLLLAFALCGCHRESIRKVTLQIVSMETEEDVRAITNAIRQTDGVLNHWVDFNASTVTVEFDSLKTALKNIEHSIVQAGYGLPNRPIFPTRDPS